VIGAGPFPVPISGLSLFKGGKVIGVNCHFCILDFPPLRVNALLASQARPGQKPSRPSRPSPFTLALSARS